MAVLLPIWSTKRETAHWVRQRIGAVMKWAVAQGYRHDNPAGDATAAALPQTAVRKQDKRALPHAEVGAAFQRAKGSGAYLGTMLAVEFLVLTAAHSSTGRHAAEDEFGRFRLGHRHPRMTQRYAHVGDSETEAAVARVGGEAETLIRTDAEPATACGNAVDRSPPVRRRRSRRSHGCQSGSRGCVSLTSQIAQATMNQRDKS